MLPKRIRVAALLCATAPLLLSQAPATSPAGQTQKELVLGAALGKHIEQRDGLLQNAAVLQYVEKIAGRLALYGAAPRLEVRLTAAYEQYATLLPGRILYLSSGLLLRLNSEAELAAILAHEQAHSASLRFIHTGLAQSVPIRVGNCVLSSPVVPLGWAAGMRQSEVEANSLAVQRLRAAGYDPVSLFAVLSKLSYDHPGWDKALVSEDLQAARTAVEAEPFPSGGYIADTSDFAAVHDLLEDLAGVRPKTQPTLLR